MKDGEKTPKLGQYAKILLIIISYSAGHFPLHKLVYHVFPLPQSMYIYVYDFGTVSGKTENEYIEKIVKNQVCVSV